MLLVCPACATEYTVADGTIGAGGRRVRCHRCGHVWQQTAPASASQPPAVPAAGAPPPAAPPAAPAASPPVSATPAEPAAAPTATPEPAVTRSIARAVPPPPKRPAVGLWVAWAVLLAVIMASAAGLIMLRETVIAHFPQAERLYAFFEAGPGEPPGAGLEIRNVRFTLESEGGSSLLKVTGEVANVTTAQREVPRLRVALADEKGREIRHWYVAAPKPVLESQEVAPFATGLSNPPEGARSLKVTLLVEP